MAEILVEEIIHEDTLGDRFLTFKLDKEVYGIEIRNVTEIIGMQTIVEVPEMQDYIRGIINLRGKIIPVMDVRLRFKKSLREYTDRTCVIVANIHDQTIGLIVDGVSEVTSIPETEIVSLPEIGKEGNKFIKGVVKCGNEVKLLLDCEKLLNHQDAEYLSKIQ